MLFLSLQSTFAEIFSSLFASNLNTIHRPSTTYIVRDVVSHVCRFLLIFWFIVVCELINGDVLNHLNVHQMLRNVIVCGGAYFQLASKYFQADFKSWFPSLAFFVAFFFTLLSFIFCIKYFPLFSLLLFYIPFCFLSPKENTLAHVYTKKPTK